MERLTFIKLPTLFFCTLVLALTSCNNDDDQDLVVPAAPISYVSLYHASPDAPPIGVFLDERQVN